MASNTLLNIALQGIRLYGYHGVHAAERAWGTWFELDLQIGIHRPHIHHLQDTVDYEMLLQLCKEEFSAPVDLLEDILIRIEQRILHAVPDLQTMQLSIRKLHPPLPASVQASVVSLNKTYSAS